MPSNTSDREFESAECLVAHCIGVFTTKKQAKEHMAETKHSVIIRERVITIWRF